MGDMQGSQILLQILCWLRFLTQCFSECIHSPTEIEPCALGVTVICLILNKTFGKHVVRSLAESTVAYLPLLQQT